MSIFRRKFVYICLFVQIEELVRGYSQLEETTQAFLESQPQYSTEDFPAPAPPLANQDFQAEFLKCMFNDNQIEALASNARANQDAETQHEYDSQTDVETVVRTYMTSNSNWNETMASKVIPH